LTEKRQKKIIQPNDRADLQKLTPSWLKKLQK
jgi:hypothetical protein